MAKIQTFAALLKKAGMFFKEATKVTTTKSGTSIFNVVLKDGGSAQYTVSKCGNKLRQTVSQIGGKSVSRITENLDDVAKIAHAKDGKSILIPGQKISSSIMDYGKRCSQGIHASVQKTYPAVKNNIVGGKGVQEISYGVETHADDLMENIIMPTDSRVAANGNFLRVFQREPRLDSNLTGASLTDLNKIYG